MANDGVPATVPASVVQVSQVPPSSAELAGGKSLPQGGNRVSAAAAAVRSASSAAASSTAATKSDLAAQVAQLNKYLNDSGRANQFRVDPKSRDQTIQEINPATGEVIGEFAAMEFPALARSLGVSGVVVDSRA